MAQRPLLMRPSLDSSKGLPSNSVLVLLMLLTLSGLNKMLLKLKKVSQIFNSDVHLMKLILKMFFDKNSNIFFSSFQAGNCVRLL